MRIRALLLLIAIVLGGCPTWAKTPSDTPVDVEIPYHPIPVKANGKIHLLYELHLTNMHASSLVLTQVQVSDSSERIVSCGADELPGLMSHAGAPKDKSSAITGGTRAVVFLDLAFDSLANLPHELQHRLCFRGEDTNGGESCISNIPVAVDLMPSIVLSPPLRGGDWVALNGLSNNSSHRRALVVVNGKVHLAQRYATDWSRIGNDGLAFRGDPSVLANWSPYGAEVLAVADAKVADVRDEIPENNPASGKKAIPINVDTAPGNYVVLDLKNGYFALYAHLKPGSIRVKAGDRVRRGEVLALLGNSGNSDAPHLHFHVMDADSPLGAEGVPFVFDEFEQIGFLAAKSQLVSGGWRADPKAAAEVRREMPAENAVVRFP